MEEGTLKMSFLKKTFLFLQSKTPGARTIKTGIAISISMLLCEILSLPSPVLAGAATISNMQPGTGESIDNAKDQALAHMIAIITAIIFGIFFGANPLIIGIVSIVIITICLALKIESSIRVAIIAAIFILYSPGSNYLLSAIQRTGTIFVGISVGLLINITILPPENEKRVQGEFILLHKEISDFFEESFNNYLLIQNTDKDVFAEKERKIEENIETAKVNLDSFKAELNFDSIDRKEKEEFYEKYLAYQIILLKNIGDIYALSERRRDRVFNKKVGIPEEYFSEINSLIVQIFSDFQKWNDQVIKKVKGESVDYLEIESFWDAFNERIVEQYDAIADKKKFIPTIIEVSILVYKIKWTMEEAKKIILNYKQVGGAIDDF